MFRYDGMLRSHILLYNMLRAKNLVSLTNASRLSQLEEEYLFVLYMCSILTFETKEKMSHVHCKLTLQLKGKPLELIKAIRIQNRPK